MTNLDGRELNIDELERVSGGSAVMQLIGAFKEGIAIGLDRAERWKNMPKPGTGPCKNHNGV
jgi:hypothetical protein